MEINRVFLVEFSHFGILFYFYRVASKIQFEMLLTTLVCVYLTTQAYTLYKLLK
jgi:hypothetical protein